MTNTTKKRITKKAQLIKLLGAKSGAEIQTLSDKLGWQPHTVRAALLGLRKAGCAVSRDGSSKDGPAKYRILPASSKADVAPVEATQNGA